MSTSDKIEGDNEVSLEIQVELQRVDGGDGVTWRVVGSNTRIADPLKRIAEIEPRIVDAIETCANAVSQHTDEKLRDDARAVLEWVVAMKKWLGVDFAS